MNWRAMNWEPCPFCGSEALRVEDVGPLAFAVICNECDAIGPSRHWPINDPPEEREWSLNRTAEEAIEAWNKRT